MKRLVVACSIVIMSILPCLADAVTTRQLRPEPVMRVVFTHINKRLVLQVTGYDAKCTLTEDARFKRAAVVHQGKTYVACWARVDAGHAFIIDETGDGGTIELGTGV